MYKANKVGFWREFHNQWKEENKKDNRHLDSRNYSKSPLLDFGDKFATCSIVKDIEKVADRHYIIKVNNVKRENVNQNYVKNKMINVKITKLGEHYRFNYYVSPKYVSNSRVDYSRKTDLEKVDMYFKNYLNSTSEYRVYDEWGLPVELYSGEFEEQLRNVYDYVEFKNSKNKKDSLKRSKQKIFDLAMCNPQLDKFVTLTYADDEFVSYDRAYEEFKKFRDRFQKYLKRNFNFKFQYLAVFETQKNGRWHIHMLCNVPAEMINYRTLTIDECFTGEEYYDLKAKKMKRRLTEKAKDLNLAFKCKFWQQGFVQYVPLKDSVGSAYYLSKYITKECDKLAEEQKIKCRYLCSKGLNQPEVTFIYEEEENKEIEDKKNSVLADTLSLVRNSDLYDTHLNVYEEYRYKNNYNDVKQILQVDYRKKV